MKPIWSQTTENTCKSLISVLIMSWHQSGGSIGADACVLAARDSTRPPHRRPIKAAPHQLRIRLSLTTFRRMARWQSCGASFLPTHFIIYSFIAVIFVLSHPRRLSLSPPSSIRQLVSPTSSQIYSQPSAVAIDISVLRNYLHIHFVVFSHRPTINFEIPSPLIRF